MNSTQNFQSFADLIDQGTRYGRRMIYRKQTRRDRWHAFVEFSAWFTAFAMVAAVLGGCGWLMWEALSGMVSLVSGIFQ